MTIALIFDKCRADTLGTYIERACHALGVACDHWWLRDAEQIPATYDLYLRIDHGDDYLTALPTHLHPAVFYAIDTHLPASWRKIRRAAANFDAICCCHHRGAERVPGALWLPVGCDWERHGDQGRPRTVDIAFVGMDGGIPRKFYLQALRERYPNSVIGTADHTRLGELYGQARIGFNYSIADDINMRMFEVLASGALLVTNHLAHGDLRALGLEAGRQFVSYRTPTELFEQLDYFLKHPEERGHIAQAGCDAARQRHTYAHRLRQLFDHLARTLGVTIVPSRHGAPATAGGPSVAHQRTGGRDVAPSGVEMWSPGRAWGLHTQEAVACAS